MNKPQFQVIYSVNGGGLLYSPMFRTLEKAHQFTRKLSSRHDWTIEHNGKELFSSRATYINTRLY